MRIDSFLTAFLAAAFLVGPAGLAADKPTRPNIVFILFDDLGYGEPPGYRAGSPFKMPTLDRLAGEGMRFTDAHTASAVCTPTRYGVLTGRYPMRIGQFGVLTTFSPPIIERERLTVASLLKQQGYHTAAFGKWHLGMNWNLPPDFTKSEKAIPSGTVVTDGPITRGFDVFSGYTHARTIGMVIEQDRVAMNVAPVDVQPFLMKKAVAYIEERAKASEPFFLYVPLCTPHSPLVPAAEFVGKGGAEKYADWMFQGDWVIDFPQTPSSSSPAITVRNIASIRRCASPSAASTKAGIACRFSRAGRAGSNLAQPATTSSASTTSWPPRRKSPARNSLPTPLKTA